MNKLTFIIVFVFIITANAFAKQQPGWKFFTGTNNYPEPVVSKTSIYKPSGFRLKSNEPNSYVKTSPPAKKAQKSVSENLAPDDLTEEILELARALQYDYKLIFEHVLNNIDYIPYYGCLKGATLTWLDRAGNDFDQATLLVALLRASGYTARYVYGYFNIPVSSANKRDMAHWLQVDPTEQAVSGALLKNGILSTTENGYSYHNRIWVEVELEGVYVPLDPSFKVYECQNAHSNILSEIGYNRNDFLTTIGGSGNNNYVQNISALGLKNKMTELSANMLNYIYTNAPNSSVQDIYGGCKIVQEEFIQWSPYLEYEAYIYGYWTNVPQEEMHTLRIEHSNEIDETFNFPELASAKLAITYKNFQTSPYPKAYLWMNDELIVYETSIYHNPESTVKLTIDHPYFNGHPDFDTYFDQVVEYTVKRGDTYVIIYDFGASQAGKRIEKIHQKQLYEYRAEGLTDSSRQVLTETLNLMGLMYFRQDSHIYSILNNFYDVRSVMHHNVGLMAQEKGYYIDIQASLINMFSRDGGSGNRAYFTTSTMMASALEHGIIEQMQDNQAVSTIDIFSRVNANNMKIFYLDKNNYSTISPLLSGYHLPSYQSAVNNGFAFYLPQNADISAGSWSGYGYISIYDTAEIFEVGMIIGGGYNGGYSENEEVASAENLSSDLVETYKENGSFSNPQSKDPVDMLTGDFTFEHNDLAIDGPEPRGLHFTRNYLSSLKHQDHPQGYGWTHNYDMYVSTRSSHSAPFGLRSPADVTPLMTAIMVANDINENVTTPKGRIAAALTINWVMNQLIENTATVTFGKKSLDFTLMPDGSYVSPPGTLYTLTKTNNTYTLQERHGKTYIFNHKPTGSDATYISTIRDPWNKEMTFTYNGELLQTVTDAYNRNLTFSYTNSNISHIDDSTGRRMSFAYQNNNLTKYTDPENNEWDYIYDNNHRLLTISDPYDHVTVSNKYNNLDDVTLQISGSKNQYNLYFSDFRNLEEDPSGGQDIYRFNRQGLQIAKENVLEEIIQMDYDGQNQLIKYTDARNNVTIYEYDEYNNLTNTIDTYNNSASTTYDSKQRPTTIGDFRKNATEHQNYNSQHQPQTIIPPEDEQTTITYYPHGGIHTITTPDNHITTNYYDAHDRLQRIVYDDDSEEVFQYDNRGNLTNYMDGNGNKIKYTYDNNRNLLTTTYPDNSIVSNAYYDNGLLKSVTDGRTNTTTYTYNGAYKISSITYPDNTTTKFGYDERDLQTSITNTLNEVTRTTYDKTHRIITKTDPLTRSNYLNYDKNGNLTTITNKRSYVTTMTYTDRNELFSTSNAQKKVTYNLYDPNGNRTNFINRAGEKYKFTYDKQNRLLTSTTPTDKTTTITYNNRGLINTLEEPSGQTTTFSQYDPRGRLQISSDPAGTISRTYDENGNLRTITEGTNTISRGYNSRNRIITYTNQNNQTIGYTYNENNYLETITYPNNKTVTNFYDNMNRLDYIRDWNKRLTDFTYDEIGRLRFIDRPNGTQRETRYNDAGEITQIWERDSDGRIIHLQKITKRDGNGNIEKQLVVPIPQDTTISPINATYHIDNRLMTFNGLTITHDPDGNMTSGPLLEDTLQTYTFDSRNRLTSAGGISSTYDAQNNLMAQDGWQYTVNPNATLSQILKAQKGSDIRHYIYGAGLLYEEKSDGSTITYHFDHLGNTVALSDDSGTVIARREYTPYGLTSHHTGTHETPFWYGGRFGVLTANNGLMSMRARWYNPYLGRFVSQDPIGFEGGLNWFAYANGNPVNKLDPFGLFGIKVGGSVSAGAIIGGQLSGGVLISYDTHSNAPWYSTDRIEIGGYFSYGGGVVGGAFVSAGGEVGFSPDANHISDLSGTTIEVGGSAGGGGGGGFNIESPNFSPNSDNNTPTMISLTFGFEVGGEVHLFANQTHVSGNILDNNSNLSQPSSHNNNNHSSYNYNNPSSVGSQSVNIGK